MKRPPGRPARRLVQLLVSLLLLLGLSCSPTPIAPVATGTRGVFLRAIPARGGFSADARAGLAARPEHWPPLPLHDDCTSGVREDEELAASLGIPLTPLSCPWADMAPVPTIGPPSANDSNAGDSGTTLGFGVHCYPFGEAILVLETTERTGDCTHIVGLGLFPKARP